MEDLPRAILRMYIHRFVGGRHDFIRSSFVPPQSFLAFLFLHIAGRKRQVSGWAPRFWPAN
jgi:hypothetical protein